MIKIQTYINNLKSIPNENYLILIIALIGIILLMSGIAMTSYKGTQNAQIKAKKKRNIEKMSQVLDKFTNIPILKGLKGNIKKSLSFNILEDYRLNIRANIITILLVITSILLTLILWDKGQLWYVKLLVIVMSIFFPYYILTFILDIQKRQIEKQIPALIDEFTSAFVSTPRVKDALLETSKKIDRKLGRIIAEIADSPYVEDGLVRLRNRLDNTWLNIFVIIIINHKTSGGDLTEQLYRLKATVARYNKIQKKKDKRLVMYELFAVLSAVFSVPLVFYINTALLGADAIMIDAQSNMTISKIILSSVFALVVIRILRRM